MTTAPFLQHVLQCLRRIFKASVSPSALAWIFRQLLRLRSTFLFKLFLWRKGSRPPSSTSRSSTRASWKSDEMGESYTIVRNGEIVSLEGIAASLYPFSNGNIRNTSRSSVRSSQNHSARSRNASRSSRRPESFISHQSVASSAYLNDLAPINTRRHPAPRRQWSSSAPHLQTDIPARTSTPSPESEIQLEVTSPGNISQSSLHTLPNPLPSFPYSHSPHSQLRTDEINTVGAPVTDNPTTLEVPRSLSSTHASSRTDEQAVSVEVDHSSDLYINPSAVHIPARTPSQLSASDPRYVRPVFPTETRRYAERTRILKRETELAFPPITLDFSKPVPPAGWIRYAHPEGARYFYNQEKNVYTDTEIYDPEIFSYLEEKIDQLKAMSVRFANPFPETGEFVINAYRTPDGSMQSEYYCVDHHTRVVFFLKTMLGSWTEAWTEAPGVTSPTQFQIELHAQYWFFVQLFPSGKALSKELVCELRDMVLHCIGDSMTSPYSTACFTLDNLYKILTLTSELDKNVGQTSRGSMCLFSRKMYIFLHSRFLNFHGESCARIERDFSVYGDESHNRRTLLIKTLSMFLFSAPDVHLTNLQKMWVDGVMHKSVWEESMKKMNDEWQEFVFFATVVLNANVAFLAIQTVDVDNHPYRSPAQISSYLSIVANIASVILGLLLMRQNRTKSRETADEVQNFLNARNHPRLGLESLAILYSLPYALLMWGMVAFLAAFAFMCFDDANASTRSLVGSGCFAMAILIGWCIYVSWEKKEKTGNPERPLAYLEPDNENYYAYREGVPKDETSDEDHDIKNTALRRLRKFSEKFKHHRASCDSGKTAVCGTNSDV